jgi:hypothetical protein
MTVLLQTAFTLALLAGQNGGSVKPGEIHLPRPLTDTDGVAKEMAYVAEHAIDLDAERDPIRKLDNRLRLELAAGRFLEAARTAEELNSLEDQAPRSKTGLSVSNLRWSIYAEAKAAEAAHSGEFANVFIGRLRETLEPIS